MASWIGSFTQSPNVDVEEEEDFFPALFAETHPLPPAAPSARGNVSPFPVGTRLPALRDRLQTARKERVA